MERDDLLSARFGGLNDSRKFPFLTYAGEVEVKEDAEEYHEEAEEAREDEEEQQEEHEGGEKVEQEG